ncbi:hypothetical protein COCOBI_02-5720 [Coccomyxa sp. Obi]|nr:hypothetical protein COCOBI_02-5720 [Coccomyxa sp. Obi]
MRAVDGPAALQLPPPQQLPLDPAASIDLIEAVPGALAAPGRGWTPAALYARYSEPLQESVPSMREIMVQQGHIDWARLQRDKKAAQWMNKF